ncbi:(2Fe-2S)-binding protein [Allostella vacuolata]|nr:(2Fe-2S)-binding protein [Stella vacuolata]
MNMMLSSNTGDRSLDALVQDVLAGANQTARTASTLPPRVYSSQAFYDLEVERIFKRDWLCVGHVSQVANVGDYYCVDLLGEPLVVVRGKDRIRVLSRVCLHRWAPIATGQGNTNLFSCPFHRWGYGLDGRLLGAPFMDDAENFDHKSCRLPEMRTEIVEALGLIFVTFSDEIGSITERLATLCLRLKNWKIGELVGVEPSEMDAEFNWKIQLETGMECYHHFAAHPKTFEVDHPSRLSWCEDSKGTWSTCHSPARDDAPDEVYTIGLPTFPDLEPAERRVFDLYHIFPLTRFSAFADRVNFRVLYPMGPNRTVSKAMWLVRPEVAARKDLIEERFATRRDFMNQAAEEDYAIDLMQQVGSASVLARPGRLSPMEATVWHLAEYVRQRIAAN